MSNLERSIELNNHAATLINQGQYGEAIATLTPTIRCLRESTREPRTNDPMSAGSICFALDDCLASSSSSHNKSIHQQQQQQLQSNKCLHHAEGYQFEQAVFIPVDLIEVPTNAHTYSLLSVVVLFTLALSNHLAASSHVGESQQQACLLRAVKLYDLTYSLMTKQGLLGPASVQFALAVVNNMGVIFHLVGDADKAQQCFERNLSIIMMLVDTGMGGTVTHLDGYFRNSSSFVQDGITTTAGAA